mgnify:FL=1
MEDSCTAPFVKVLNCQHHQADVLDSNGCTRTADSEKTVSTQTIERVFATFKEHMNLQTLSQLIDQRCSNSNKKEDVDAYPPDSEQVQGKEECKGGNIHIDVALFSRKKKQPNRGDQRGNKHVDVGVSCGSKKEHLKEKDARRDKRGSKHVDFGYACGQNQAREKEWDGIAVPRKLRVHNVLSPEQKKFVGTLFSKFSIIIKELEPIEGIYQHPEGVSRFAARLGVDNIITAMRAASTNGDDKIVLPHCDDHNCDHPLNSPVYCYSAYNSGGERMALISYSRKSITESVGRWLRYYRAIRFVVDFAQKQPEERVLTGDKFFDSLVFDNGAEDRIFLKPPHFDKTVWMSCFADLIIKACNQYNLSREEAIGILFCVIASQDSQYFQGTIARLLSDPSTFYTLRNPKDPFAIGHSIYHQIFALKAAKAYRGGNRHQPAHNIEISQDEYYQSVIFLSELSYAFDQVDDSEIACGDEHYFVAKAIGLTEASCKGVGYLLSQHLIQIGAIVGLFPPKLLLSAIICPGTRTYDFLHEEFELFHYIPGSSSQWCDDEDSINLLSAVSYCLGVSVFIAENITCQAVQHSNNANTRFCDIVYREQTVFSLVAGKQMQGSTALLCSRTAVLLRRDTYGKDLHFTLPKLKPLTDVHDELPHFLKS